MPNKKLPFFLFFLLIFITIFPAPIHAQNSIICDSDIMLVLDRTSSMKDPEQGLDPVAKIQRIKEASLALIDTVESLGLPAGSVRIGISTIQHDLQSDGTYLFTKLYVPLTGNTPAELNTLRSKINSMQPSQSNGAYTYEQSGNGTCIACALAIANQELNAKKISGRNQYIILLSDGVSAVSLTNQLLSSQVPQAWALGASQTRRISDQGQSTGIKYFAIGFGQGTQTSVYYPPGMTAAVANPSTDYFYRPNPSQWASTLVGILPQICTAVTPTPTSISTPTHTLTPTPTLNLPPPVINARTHLLSAGDIFDCSNLPGSFLDVSYNLSPINISRASNGSSYALWNNGILYNTPYRLEPDSNDLGLNKVVGACLYKIKPSLPNEFAGISLNGQISSSANDRGLRWEIAVGPVSTWTQTKGGDVYARDTIASLLPSGEEFNLDGAPGSPGVVSYGSDLNLDGTSTDFDSISSTDWHARDTFTPKSYYIILKNLVNDRLDTNPPSLDTLSSYPGSIPGEYYYYFPGNQSLNYDINVSGSQKFVIVIEGNLTINAKINIQAGGFLIFLVKDGITINDDVGESVYKKTNNINHGVLDGIFVTDGIFNAGIGNKQLSVKGMVIAGSFVMQRNLGNSGDDFPPQTFVFDPQLHFTMPEALKTSKVIWQEVAP